MISQTKSKVTYDQIKQYVDKFNLNILPTFPGEKHPALTSWKTFQNEKLTDQDIQYVVDYLNENADSNIGTVCGKISGGLEVIDIDNKLGNADAVFNDFKKIDGVGELVRWCPVEKTQSGGYHIFYRCEQIEGNLKIAKQFDETIIETRGEGGYCVISPSKGYDLIQGSFADIPVITIDERDTLLSAARSFDKQPTQPPRPKSLNIKGLKGTTPWDDFNERPESLTEVKELLREHGWTYIENVGDNERWRRPGKNHGISADYKDKSFYVFSSNADPFEPEKAYYPFAVYTILMYGNDPEAYRKAALDMIERGFGNLDENSKNKVVPPIIRAARLLDKKYDFRLNDVTAKLEYKLKADTKFIDAEDYHINSIYNEIQLENISYTSDKLHNLLNSEYVTKFDPLIEYFEQLPVWDNHDYIADLAKTVKLADSGKKYFWIKSLKKFLTAYVGCAIDANITNETSIIFYGAQGVGKTKWLNKLFPPGLDEKKYLYVGNIYNDKDSKLNLSIKLLINLDELGSLNRQEIGYLKSLYTTKTISLREPYGRKQKSYIRRASFVGSVDKQEFLADQAGNRRFLCFSVADINYQHKVDMDKVFAQALSLYNSGYRFYFDQAEIAEINKNNSEFELSSNEEYLLTEHYRVPTSAELKNNQCTYLLTTEIAAQLENMSDNFKSTPASIRALGQALSKNGFQKISKSICGKSLKRWAIIRPSGLVQFDPLTGRLNLNAASGQTSVN